MKALGVNPEFVDTSSGFHAGTLGVTDDFRVFMYQKAGEGISENDACEVRMEDGEAYQLSESRTSGTSGNIVGVAHRAVASGEYGWFQVYGPCQVSSAVLTRGDEVAPGGTAGQLSVPGTRRPIDGLLITGGSGSLANASLSYPRIAANIGSSGTGSSNVPDKPATPVSDTEYNLKIETDGTASWEPDTSGGEVISPADGVSPKPDDTDGAVGTDAAYAREDHKHPLPDVATATANGLMPSADFNKLAGIATGATASDLPNKPAASMADAVYDLKIETDGTASWEETIGESVEGGLTFTNVGNTLTLTSNAQTDTTTGATEGPEMEDLGDVFHLAFLYDRSGAQTQDTWFNTLYEKSEVGADSANPKWVQWQGSGEAAVALYVNDGKLTIGPYPTAFGAGATVTISNITGRLSAGSGGDASDADVTALQNEVDTLQHLTRDLHIRKILSDWSDVADSDADLYWAVAVGGEITLTDANFDDQGTSITIPASTSERTTYVFVRLPAATDASMLRTIQGNNTSTSNHWGLAADEGVTVPDNDTYQYWMAVINPQETASLTFQLQERSAIESTRYDGKLGGESLIQAQNADRFAGLDHLTRDLHINTNNPDWENATDDLVDLYGVYTSSVTTLTDANFDNNGAVILIASDAATTVFVRLPVAANYLRYRVVFPNGVARAGNAWTSVTGPDETTYQYWSAGSVDHPGGSVTKAEFHEVELEDTIYTGSGSIPTGGTTGQALVKRTGDSYDVEWGTVSGGGSVTIVDALPETIPGVGTAFILRDPVGERDEGVYIVKSHGGDYYEGAVVNSIDSVIAVQANLDNNPNGSVSEIEWTLNGLHLYMEFHKSAFTGTPPGNLYIEITHLDTAGGAIDAADELSSGDRTNSRVTLVRQADYDRLGHYSYGNKLSGATMTLWGGIDVGERLRFKVYTDSGYSTPLVTSGGKYYDLITEDKFPRQMALERLAQGGAKDGQTIAWDDGNNVWSPTDALETLEDLTRDLHIVTGRVEYQDASDSVIDLFATSTNSPAVPPPDVTLTDANFNNNGADIAIGATRNLNNAVYARIPVAQHVTHFRIVWEGFRNKNGNAWIPVTGPTPATYKYYFVNTAGDAAGNRVYAQIRAAVDATRYEGDGSIPAGGTAGQVLAKVTADDYSTAWVDAAAGGGSGGDFLELIGGSAAALALDADTVADTGIDMPASIGDNEVWAVRIEGERYDDLAFFNAKLIEDRNGTTVGATLDPDSNAGLNAGVLIRGRRNNSTQTDVILLAKDTGTTGHVLIASTHSNLDPKPTLYRVTGGGGGGGEGGTDDAIARAAAAAAQMDANAAQNTADAALPKAGGTMTGALTLHGAPTADLHPATKKYADSISGVALAALPRAGGNMTGALVLHDAPSADLQAATKKYVDDNDERLKDFDTEPDVDDYELGEIIAVDDSFRKMGTTDADTPNLYEATVGRDSIHLGSEHWRGVAGSQSPNGFTTDGGFSANPDNAIVMIMASDARHIRVIVKRSVFEQFKTSDFETTDKLHMTLAMQSGDSDIVDMAYYNSYTRDTSYLIFQHQHASGNYNLYDEPAGNNLGATFRVGSNTGNQFVHEVATKHWLVWPSDPHQSDAGTALALAQANKARLDALDAAVDGGATPIHDITYDDTTALLAPLAGDAGDNAVETTYTDVQRGDLLVFDWTKCEHLNDHHEHVVPGSNTDAGRMYVTVDQFNNVEWDGEFIYALERALQDNGSADTLNSWIVGTIIWNAPNLTFGLHLQQGGTRTNRNLKARAGFSLRMRVFRNTTPAQATSDNIHARVLALTAQLDGLTFSVLTDAEYTALATKDEDTIYFTTAT